MNIAAIPVKNKIEWTAPLVEHLLLHDDLDQIWIYDNGSTDITREWVENRKNIDQRITIFDVPDMKIYDMWNDMILIAAEEYKTSNLAILNNDIRLPPYAIRDMSLMMRKEDYQIAAVDPTRTGLYTFSIGWWDLSRALPHPIQPYCERLHIGDRIGWAFVVAAEFWKNEKYAIHPDYIHYFGDDDLYRRAMHRGGNACIVRGIGCDHAESTTGGIDGDLWKHDEDIYMRLWDGTSSAI